MYPGHARKVGPVAANLLASSLGKFVYIVDDDIDARDPFSVEQALSFRVDPVRDVQILSVFFSYTRSRRGTGRKRWKELRRIQGPCRRDDEGNLAAGSLPRKST